MISFLSLSLSVCVCVCVCAVPSVFFIVRFLCLPISSLTMSQFYCTEMAFKVLLVQVSLHLRQREELTRR